MRKILTKHKNLLIYGSIGIAAIATTGILLYKKRKSIVPIVEGFVNYFGEKTKLSGYPRGVTNNNPGNLIKTSIKWQGKIPNDQNTDGHFEQFYSYEYGLRAMLKDIMNDYKKGSKTVRKLISEYAPPHENNTKVYIEWVAKALGVSADETFSLSKNNLKTLTIAIVKMENGTNSSGKVYLRNSQFETAYKLI